MSTCPSSTGADQSTKIRFPGGATLQVLTSQTIPNGLQVTKSLLSQASSALAPLAPIFNLIDALLAVKEFAEAVPKLLTDPTALAEAIINLVEKIAKLASLIPQLSVPLLIVDLFDVVIGALDGVVTELEKVVAQEARIQAAIAKAQESGNEALQDSIDCANDINDQVKAGIAAGVAPLNPLFAVMNIFLGLIGAPEIPSIENLPDDASEAVEYLGDFVDILQNARDAIPIP